MQAVAIQDTRYKAPHVLQLNGCKPPPFCNQPTKAPTRLQLVGHGYQATGGGGCLLGTTNNEAGV